ncbi:hypothetical protein [Tumebacillus permanentifrigoris]|nr:hypothetical protein [Tumebacillus permanentifrigoris]
MKQFLVILAVAVLMVVFGANQSHTSTPQADWEGPDPKTTLVF